jgi:predicted lipoprotein with Yx(FWY)xxD motif
MKNAMRAPSTAIKATVFLGIAALLVAGCASKKSSSSAAASSAPATSAAAAAPAATSAAAPAAGSAGAVAPAATSAAASAAGPAGPTTVATKMGPLGAYLTDASGKTLYMYTPDTSPTSTCYGQCIANWPALLTNGAPQAGTGATATFLGTSPRTDGSSQVTYKGHPLYYFKGDKAAGDTSGQGKADTWFLVSPTGAQIGSAAKAAAAPTKAAPTKAAPTKAAPTKAATPAPTKAATPAPTKAAPTTAAPPTPSPTKSATGGGWA